ncbi:MAG TPA: lysophospholipid acyltransferase family protein [Ktedonobacteraceae bacterium]|nr:lysophospholipid acyltransferase family protein [Ktedonobacteraceae bacterium]
MTQQSSATSAVGNPEQPEKSNKLSKSNRPAKNLYEPYDTPLWIWVSLRLVARFIFFLILNVRLVGYQNIPKEGAFMIASNHLSWMDVPLVPAYIKRKVVYMAKEELFYSKVGWLVRLLGAFPVKRGAADRQSLRAAEQQLKAGKIFIIFPEGTRSKNHQLAQAHVGLGMIALRSGVPVIPVAVWGSEYALKKFRPRVTISYGEPMLLAPKGRKITREDIDDATTQVMRHIAAMMPPQYRGMYGDELSEPNT